MPAARFGPSKRNEIQVAVSRYPTGGGGCNDAPRNSIVTTLYINDYIHIIFKKKGMSMRWCLERISFCYFTHDFKKMVIIEGKYVVMKKNNLQTRNSIYDHKSL